MKKKKAIIICAVLIIAIVIAVVIVMYMKNLRRDGIDNDPEPAVSGESNVLVAYFSWSGNVQQMARWISEETDGDLFRIVPSEPYGKNFDDCADRAKNELDNGIRPEISEHINGDIMKQYDVIYIGFRYGGMIFLCRYGLFLKNMIYQEKKLFHSFLITEVPMAQAV